MQTSSCLISRILNTTMFESWEIIGPYPSWWLFNSLLLIVQVLHIIWSYYIIRIAYKAMARGKVCMTNFITRKMSMAFIFFTMSFESIILKKEGCHLTEGFHPKLYCNAYISYVLYCNTQQILFQTNLTLVNT